MAKRKNKQNENCWGYDTHCPYLPYLLCHSDKPTRDEFNACLHCLKTKEQEINAALVKLFSRIKNEFEIKVSKTLHTKNKCTEANN